MGRAEVEYLEHEHRIERPEQGRGKAHGRGEQHETHEHLIGAHAAQLAAPRRLGHLRAVVGGCLHAPLAQHRDNAQDQRSAKEQLEGEQGAVEPGEQAGHGQHEPDEGQVEQAVAHAEIFPAQPDGDGALHPGIPSDAVDGGGQRHDRKGAGEHREREEVFTARQERERHQAGSASRRNAAKR